MCFILECNSYINYRILWKFLVILCTSALIRFMLQIVVYFIYDFGTTYFYLLCLIVLSQIQIIHCSLVYQGVSFHSGLVILEVLSSYFCFCVYYICAMVEWLWCILCTYNISPHTSSSFYTSQKHYAGDLIITLSLHRSHFIL